MAKLSNMQEFIMRHIGLKLDLQLFIALGLAVIQSRRDNPEKNTTRSSFIRDAIERAILEMGVIPSPKIRSRT